MVETNDVEVTFVRQSPVFTHNSLIILINMNLWLLFTDYETSGKAWDKWLGTKSGQKLNSKWQEIATCDVKFMAMYLGGTLTPRSSIPMTRGLSLGTTVLLWEIRPRIK